MQSLVQKIVITGVYFDNERIGVVCFDNGKIEYIFSQKMSRNYHGTGDIFASTLVGAYLNGRSLKASAEIAVNFVTGCIKRTITENPEMEYGTNFEGEIPNLIKYLEF